MNKSVKSADLDSWTLEQVQNMECWGNEKANAFWEANLPSNSETLKRDMNSFIRAKYEKKAFALHKGNPDPNINNSTNSSKLNNNLIDTKPVDSSSNGFMADFADFSQFNAKKNPENDFFQSKSSNSNSNFNFNANFTNTTNSKPDIKSTIMSLYNTSTSNPNSTPTTETLQFNSNFAPNNSSTNNFNKKPPPSQDNIWGDFK